MFVFVYAFLSCGSSSFLLTVGSCCSACSAVDVLDPRPDAIFLIRDLFRALDSGQIGSCAELRTLVGISSGQQDAEEFETVLLARIQNELAELSTTEVRPSRTSFLFESLACSPFSWWSPCRRLIVCSLLNQDPQLCFLVDCVLCSFIRAGSVNSAH